jgi:hypothetical protein
MKPVFERAAELLGEALAERSLALLSVALDFACWRNLAQTHDPASAAALVTDAIIGVATEQGQTKLRAR